ncbi:MAG: hypothetical protein MUF56_07335 [Solirubrobacteraceae bacterium]|nr:hypothetical protein [Solirubrobacteraceae bacterium]
MSGPAVRGGDGRDPRDYDGGAPLPSGDDTARVAVALFATHGLVPLRRTLVSLREGADAATEVVVFAPGAPEMVATYLTRQYMRGRIAGFELTNREPDDRHCGLGRAYRVTAAGYLLRAEDTLEFEPGWLTAVLGAMDGDPDIGLLTLTRPAQPRGRGRPPKVRCEVEVVDHADLRAFVTRRELFARHESESMGEQRGDGCPYQRHLKSIHKKLACLPGLVRPLADEVLTPWLDPLEALEAALPAHQGAAGALQHLRQDYHLGDDVLLTCMACGATTLEVLAARLKFCAQHQVAIGFMYELRCPDCGELHYKDDLQLRCPH